MRHTQMSQVAPQWGWHHDHQGSPDMALGDRIRQLRKEHGWSQAELGHKIDADPAAISRYEGGRITPSADALVRLAETFDVSLDHLLIDDIPRRPLRDHPHHRRAHRPQPRQERPQPRRQLSQLVSRS